MKKYAQEDEKEQIHEKSTQYNSTITREEFAIVNKNALNNIYTSMMSKLKYDAVFYEKLESHAADIVDTHNKFAHLLPLLPTKSNGETQTMEDYTLFAKGFSEVVYDLRTLNNNTRTLANHFFTLMQLAAHDMEEVADIDHLTMNIPDEINLIGINYNGEYFGI